MVMDMSTKKVIAELEKLLLLLKSGEDDENDEELDDWDSNGKRGKPKVVAVHVKTADELSNLSQFTFGEWVQAHNWDVRRAVDALNDDDDEIRYTLHQQNEDEMIDEGFDVVEYLAPHSKKERIVVVYQGNNGPSGGYQNVSREILATDVILTY